MRDGRVSGKDGYSMVSPYQSLSLVPTIVPDYQYMLLQYDMLLTSKYRTYCKV